MEAKTSAEHCIRAKAAAQYPGWHVDTAEPETAVLTNIMGHRCMVAFGHRKRRRDGPIMRVAKWIVPAVIWLLVIRMISITVMTLAMGVRLWKEGGESD